ncbi:unnamed protein product [Enterobius vermicularis]|uniref:DUF148 domain-containing protein n=1 Tax=Enterobius vermicularis TaxID=51028 RepID=A0A0N4UT24_ENTVE|nr:unnamed protein product [Enterobius vermicularis]
MRRVLAVAIMLGVAFTSATHYYSAVEMLRRFVNNPADAALLSTLMFDWYTPRSEIQQQVEAVVQRQPEDVQQIYRAALQRQENQQNYTYQRRLDWLQLRGVSQSVIDAQNEMYLIDNDMSLSMLEAQDRKRAVYGNLTFAERRQFHG